MKKGVVPYQLENRVQELGLEGLPLASFRRRLVSFLVDFSILVVVFFVAIYTLIPYMMGKGIMDPSEDYNLQFGFNNWYSLILIVVYFALSHFFMNGQTLGKKIFKLRVVSIKHPRLGFWHCVERALGYGASALELGLGFLQVMWKPDRRATHDRIAETIVIDER